MGYIGTKPTAAPLTSSQLEDGLVTAAKLATDAVETAKVKDLNVTVAKLPAVVDISTKTVTLPASVAGLGTGINVTNQITGVVPSANLGSGSASSTTYLAGDQTYQTITEYDDSVLQSNVAMLGFKVAVNGSLTRYNLVDQSIDEFFDTSGVDASASTNEIRTLTAPFYYLGGSSAAPTRTEDADDSGVDGDYTWFKWTDTGATGSYSANAAETGVDFLTIAGGGGGGPQGGSGGGAGGYRNSYASESSGGGASSETALNLGSGTTYTITVGAGGGAGSAPESNGSQGSTSSIAGSDITDITTVGGGYGTHNATGGTGGSGGGGGFGTQSGGAGTANQGYAGGDGAGGASTYDGAAGGGAGSVGGDSTTGNPGNGGTGLSSSINGSSVGRGGGGAGANRSSAAGSSSDGGGGLAAAGTVNTGGGGGASGDSSTDGGAGGSGIVILRTLTNVVTPGLDLTLQSTDVTALSSPTYGEFVTLIENAEGTATLNTDIKGYVSRDSGVTFTQGTLVDEGTWGTDKKILGFHDLTITGSAGTSMCYKITTHNQSAGSKETRVYATSIGWR